VERLVERMAYKNWEMMDASMSPGVLYVGGEGNGEEIKDGREGVGNSDGDGEEEGMSLNQSGGHERKKSLLKSSLKDTVADKIGKPKVKQLTDNQKKGLEQKKKIEYFGKVTRLMNQPVPKMRARFTPEKLEEVKPWERPPPPLDSVSITTTTTEETVGPTRRVIKVTTVKTTTNSSRLPSLCLDNDGGEQRKGKAEAVAVVGDSKVQQDIERARQLQLKVAQIRKEDMVRKKRKEEQEKQRTEKMIKELEKVREEQLKRKEELEQQQKLSKEKEEKEKEEKEKGEKDTEEKEKEADDLNGDKKVSEGLEKRKNSIPLFKKLEKQAEEQKKREEEERQKKLLRIKKGCINHDEIKQFSSEIKGKLDEMHKKKEV
jgi:hypothetical protein